VRVGQRALFFSHYGRYLRVRAGRVPRELQERVAGARNGWEWEGGSPPLYTAHWRV